MIYALKLEGLAVGGTTEFDGAYVKQYDPSRHQQDGSYDGGLLEVTRNIAEALPFDDPQIAYEYWNQAAGCSCHGIREDGQPNRPLTAWHASIEPIG